MAYVSKEFEEALKLVSEYVELDEAGEAVIMEGWKQNYGSINLGGSYHPKNRVPIEHYDEFKKKHPGSQVFFRGPRNSSVKTPGTKPNRTMKADATHFYIYAQSGPKLSLESIDDLDLVGLTMEELVQMAESFEGQLEKIKAKIAKKPKDDYDFADVAEKPKSPVTKVTGTYGKSWTDLDDEGKSKVAAVAATQVKRGRGRPRGSKNI